jgi:hypothetical protein
MKAKLYLTVVVCMLLSLIAVPALAEEGGTPIPMWVSRVRLAYVGRSSTGPDNVVGLVHIRDANLQRVVGAMVTVRWTLTPLDGEPYSKTASDTTNEHGVASFPEWIGRGYYELVVTDVAKEDWAYEPSLDRETESAITVPWTRR